MEEICRLCLKTTSNWNNLFKDDLPHKIKSISLIHVSPTDQLPPNVCESCENNVSLFYDFLKLITRSNCELIEILRCEQISSQDDESFDVKENIVDKFLSTNLDSVPTKHSVAHELINNNNDSTTNFVNIESSVHGIVSDLKQTNVSPTKILQKWIKTYQCKHCLFKSSFYDEYKKHVKKHKPIRKSLCTVCGISVRTDYFKKHRRNHSNPGVPCEICGKVLKTVDTLRRHVDTHKNVRYECLYCEKVYTNRAGFRGHIRIHAPGGDKKTYECSVCKKLFLKSPCLKKHMRSHTGERPYPCTYCKKGFSSSNALKTHIRQHTKEKPYACDYCDSAFPQRVSLRTHLKSKHPDKISMAKMKVEINS